MSKGIPKFIEEAAFAGAAKGGRNNRALWLAAQCRDARLGRGDTGRVMAAFAARCSPPMSAAEVEAVIRSANSRPAREEPREGVKGSRGRGVKGTRDPGEEDVIAWDAEIGPSASGPLNPLTPGPLGPSKPDYVEDVPPPSGSAVDDLRGWLAALYRPEDIVNYVCASAETEDGGFVPSGRGVSRTREAIERDLAKYEGKGLAPDEVIRAALGDYRAEAGMWARINPMDGKGCNDRNVARYDHVLVEGDKQSVGTQLAAIRSLGLPCAALTHSGGKSVHAVVRVDAGTDAALYAERVETVFRACAEAGLAVDRPNRNPSRLSRIAGPSRGGRRQYLIESADRNVCATFEDWVASREVDEFRAHVQTVDDLQREPADDSLIGQRFLCRKGSWLLVAQSGVGKSVFAMQAAVAFSIGRDMFGLKAAAPLRNLIVQSENNSGDMHEAFAGVTGGLGVTGEEMRMLRSNFRTVHCTRYTGGTFAKFLAQMCRVHRPDIVWVDPLLSFLGGEISKMQDTSRFLRNQVQPVIEDADVGLVVVHHTGKPPKGDDGQYKGHDLAYLGIGSSDITNWARATSTLIRDADADSRFTLEHAKRGDRAGCERRVAIEHSKAGLCWVKSEGEGEEVRSQKSEVRSKRSEVRSKRPEAGSQKPEAGGRSKYDGFGLETMPPVSGVWENEDRTQSVATEAVRMLLARGGVDMNLKSIATMMRNGRLGKFLAFDNAAKTWQGRMYVSDFA